MSTSEKSAARSHQGQLSKLLHEVQALRQQLRRAQRMAAVGTMTAMVAHEFNNILTPMINYAQLAKDNPSLVPKAIANAADGGRRASHICKAILGMTEESGEQTTVQIAEVVGQTLAAMARDLGKDGIDLKIDIPQTLKFKTRRVELQQVLLNLLINARTAVLVKAPHGRRIEIAASLRQGWLVMCVSDSGVGIAPENLRKIFQPFFTTRSSEGDKRGHGLGLTICQEIVTSMGGDLSVQSTPGQGAKFTVRLPA